MTDSHLRPSSTSVGLTSEGAGSRSKAARQGAAPASTPTTPIAQRPATARADASGGKSVSPLDARAAAAARALRTSSAGAPTRSLPPPDASVSGAATRTLPPPDASGAGPRTRTLPPVGAAKSPASKTAPAGPATPERPMLRPGLAAQVARWMESLPETLRPVTVAAQFPRIAERLSLIWVSPSDARNYLEELLIDDRGTRQGFPPEAASELLRLSAHLAERLDTSTVRAGSNWGRALGKPRQR
jgi:hypothetical protein